MADDISKKVLIDISISKDEAAQAVQDFKADVDALKDSVLANKAALANAKTATAQLTTELAKSKIEHQNVKIAIDKARLSQIEMNAAAKQAKQDAKAASGSYAEAQQKLTELGKAIKNAEGGFKSQNEAIKAQIAEYRDLNNQLKAFDKQMGNHQRNVGNYEKAISGISQQINRLIPGFTQFQSVLQSAAQGFNAMGKGAAETAEGMEGAEVATGALSAAAIGLTAALAAFIGVAVVTIDYLSQFAGYSDAAAGKISGLKAGWGAFMNSIANGDWKNMFDNMNTASTLAEAATLNLRDLQRQAMVAQEQTANEDAKLGVLMKTFRDKAVSAAEKQNAYTEALKLTNGQYDRNHELAVDAYNMSTLQIAAKAGLNKEQAKDLYISAKKGQSMEDLSKAYDKAIEKAYQLVKANDLDKDILKQSVDALGLLTSIDSKKENQQEMFKVRNDNQQAKAEAAAEKLKSQLETSKQALEEANNERIESITKGLQAQMDAYSKELSTTDEFYRQKIFKEQEFIEKQKKLRDQVKGNSASAVQARGNFNKAIEVAHGNMDQFGKDKEDANAKIIEDNTNKTLDLINKANVTLQEAVDRNLSEGLDKQLALLTDEQDKLYVAQDTASDETKERIDKLQADLANKKLKFSEEERQALIDKIQSLKNIQKKADAQTLAEVESIEKQKIKLRQDFDQEEQLTKDKMAVTQAELENKNPYSKSKQSAEQKLMDDQLDKDINQEGLTDAKKLLIFNDYLLKKKRLEDDFNNGRLKETLKFAQLAADGSFNILQNAIAHNAQAQEVSLEKQKNYDLQNQALTTTQRYAIEERYRIQSGQAKVKEFKQEQALNIAKTVMAGAKAIVEDLGSPEKIPFDIATTALEIGVIAEQKPPAYAKGGIHYDSDGKGGLLPGYSKVDNMNARLRSGEGIVVSEAMRDPWAKSVVSSINQSFGGRSFDGSAPVSWPVPHFASGGIYNTYMPTSDNGLRPQINVSGMGRMHPDDINAIANAVSNIKFPPMDVKDINFAQNRLAQATDRLNY